MTKYASDEYDPEMHCCRYWYKDFCDCIKEARWERKANNAYDTVDILNDNGIVWIESKTSNVVILNPDTDHAYLSLLRDNGLFKCRFKGSAKWYKFGKTKLLEKFKPKK